MKVTFKLTPNQVNKAREIVREEEGQAVGYDCGNLLGVFSGDQHFNPKQNLSLAGSTVTYNGQRCPFVQDGGLRIVLQIFGVKTPEEVPTGAIILYNTSDKRLEWYDTLASHLASQVESGVINARAVWKMAREGEFTNPYIKREALFQVFQALRARGLKPPPFPGTEGYARWAASTSKEKKDEERAFAALEEFEL